MNHQAPVLPPAPSWSFARLLLFKTGFVFTVLFCLSFAFPFNLFPATGMWLRGLFEPMARWTGQHIFKCRPGFMSEFISDSSGFYLHIFNLVFIAVAAATLWMALARHASNPQRLQYWLWAALRYYLALHLLIYGCSKVLKLQFYLPEPNTLYTPLGQLYGDIAYWSLMGLSRPYSMFLGLAEVVAALLLLFRKSMLAGALLSAGILMNVFVLNLVYDITVKIHSGTLLIFSGVLLLPYAKKMARFMAFKPVTPLRAWQPAWKKWAHQWLYRTAKALVVALLLAEALYPALKSGQVNDDAEPRPFLHGAWEVTSFMSNGDTVAPLLTQKERWKRVFFHRRHYFITQLMNDEMVDYELEYDTAHQRLYISHDTDSLQRPVHYKLYGDSLLQLQAQLNGIDVEATLRRLPYTRLPLLQREFSWTVDE